MEASKQSIRSLVIMFVAIFVGGLLAMALSRYDYIFAGRLLGGVFMGVGIMFAYVAPAKRNVWRWMYVLTTTGIVSGVIYKLLSSFFPA